MCQPPQIRSYRRHETGKKAAISIIGRNRGCDIKNVNETWRRDAEDNTTLLNYFEEA
ncbi:uncharacterized protein MYCFIDRAFT_172688 [Pseudocercospora fijiensis CIRAD86]|uniref:Uncharacterized protein n=1 Tax=Pseudocercospora fijiensis (strain CIRAD86) TaxID=383855 RepID=M2ZAZ3_PSEFD|nr:uncharacterized protein MYCFIDRAFT_172688 [Pseudocercospora fijiensis CIRAD86]EME87015.1 hypothetical protein MYCFIDRAFT_172688 [Pseudocercospora fijiensis CIRAD86]